MGDDQGRDKIPPMGRGDRSHDLDERKSMIRSGRCAVCGRKRDAAGDRCSKCSCRDLQVAEMLRGA